MVLEHQLRWGLHFFQYSESVKKAVVGRQLSVVLSVGRKRRLPSSWSHVEKCLAQASSWVLTWDRRRIYSQNREARRIRSKAGI